MYFYTEENSKIMKCCQFKKEKKCYYCHDEIPVKELTRCVRCNLRAHYICYNLEQNNNSYTQCPGCQRIGSMGITQQVIDNIERSVVFH